MPSKSLRRSVVAEGVETAAQADILKQLKCDELQGYLIAKPMPAADVARFLGERSSYADRRNHTPEPTALASITP